MCSPKPASPTPLQNKNHNSYERKYMITSNLPGELRFRRTSSFCRILSVVILSMVWMGPSRLFSQEYLIKFATLAGEGTTWLNVMRDYDQAIRKESSGRMGFKIYGNGVQ